MNRKKIIFLLQIITVSLVSLFTILFLIDGIRLGFTSFFNHETGEEIIVREWTWIIPWIMSLIISLGFWVITYFYKKNMTNTDKIKKITVWWLIYLICGLILFSFFWLLALFLINYLTISFFLFCIILGIVFIINIIFLSIEIDNYRIRNDFEIINTDMVIAYRLMLVSTIISGFILIPLLWMIPMTIKTKKLTYTNENKTGFGVWVFLFGGLFGTICSIIIIASNPKNK
ncbi:unknown transmembrane protein [Mesoplasma florum W37]|uniref:Uncharacterized protein n=1 Tax=Mesoplasma florum TaxID=2151 RepID=A0AAD0HSA9_MESFO|nr:hypothetical protein [Mesoplasma florum]AGY41524.1 unknown transmembrane protein [Mesoplasma florum W37]AVN59733.1 hypothetical protein CG008_02390 [Mesoplasma florum]AVN65863.1 hypothetical protein MflW12_4580 [Mesoplasma florum]